MIVYFQIAFAVIIPLILIWILFRYLIRLVRSVETMTDSLEEISQSLQEISDSLSEKIEGSKEQ
ncbi:MAG: hypothetical protein C0412_02670 [Flavobacterium sp.]|nr:hypothetical protein [Flavobacterium sp.]